MLRSNQVAPSIVSAGPGSMEYIAVSSAPEPVYDFTNLLHREIIKRGQDCILHYPRAAVKLVARLLLACCWLFFIFSWPSNYYLLASLNKDRPFHNNLTPDPSRNGRSLLLRTTMDLGSSLVK